MNLCDIFLFFVANLLFLVQSDSVLPKYLHQMLHCSSSPLPKKALMARRKTCFHTILL